MFDPDAFLAAVLAKAGSKAAMARALDTPTSRVAELFRDEGQRKRRLSMKEGMTLAEAFEVAPFETVNVEKLKTVLRVCRRHMPKGEWSDQALERLAREIEFGLSLLRSASDDQPSQEALDVASRAIADRFRDKPA